MSPPQSPATNSALHLPHSARSPLDPSAGIGLSVGCFAGVGHGLTVGIGTVRPLTRNVSLVFPIPSPVPFAHNGTLIGAFCGVSLSASFFSSIAFHLGYRWQLLSSLLNRSMGHGPANLSSAVSKPYCKTLSARR